MLGLTTLLLIGFLINNTPGVQANEKPTCPPVVEDPPIDILFPHESDCSKFYKCSHGVAHELDCPSDLLFNPKMNYCDWPSNVNCTNSSVCPPLGDDPGDDGLFPHKHNCSKFYQCSHGEMIEMDCPQGLHFNPRIKQCDWPHNVNCTNSNENGNENMCPSVVEDPGVDILLPHETDCSKFYKCSHGVAYEMDCPASLHFNPVINQCDWPTNVNCSSKPSESNNKTENVGNECPSTEEDPEDDILFPHESDCSKFYKCSHGQKVEFDCPSGLHFNPKTKKCDWPANVNCTSGLEHSEEDNRTFENERSASSSFESESDSKSWSNEEKQKNDECPSVEEDPEEDVLFPHESDCSKFYKCNHGVKVEQVCPAGLHFNPNIKQCDWPENANCLLEFF